MGGTDGCAALDDLARFDGRRIDLSDPSRSGGGAHHHGDLGKIKAMVDTGDVPIDLVTVETSTVLQGCDAGVLERLDYSKIADRSGFLPGTALDCGVGIDVYGDVLAYDTTVLKEAPTSILDIFDTKK